MKLNGVILILLLWPSMSLQRSDYNSSSYIAAVVEYIPVEKSNVDKDLGEVNAKNYLKIIDTATKYGIDVIVFPESTLSISSSKNETIKRSQAASYIPDPDDKIIPCDDKYQRYKYSLKTMSCAARDHQIYMVVNHREKVDCTPNGKGCATDGFLIYNTNVVFDRQGQVIAKYRKYNLFNEIGVNVTKPIPTTFKTDFGVTFGTFICYDLYFQTPTLNLTRDLGITDILYSTHWFESPVSPFAMELESGWAYTNDVNFLASGHSSPSNINEGTGIYLGKQGYIDVVSKNKSATVLLVAEIPKVINGTRKLSINRKKVHVYEFTNKEISTGETVEEAQLIGNKPNLSDYTIEWVDLTQKSQNKTLCNRGLCCNFKLTIDFDQKNLKNDSKYYRYNFVVYNKSNNLGFKYCGITARANTSAESFTYTFQSPKDIVQRTTFRSLEITTSNITNENTLLLPISFTQNMIPLNVTDFSFESHLVSNLSSSHHMKLKNSVNNLMAFAIYGRDFAQDRLQVAQGHSSTFVISPIILLVAIATHVIFNI